MDCPLAILLAGQKGGEVVFIIFIPILIIAIVARIAMNAGRADNVQAVARKLGADIVAGTWWNAGMALNVDGIPAKVDYHPGRKGQAPWTCLRFQWTPPGFLRIVPEGLFATLRKTFGARDIEVGAPDFDESFLVQGSSEKWAREVLDAETRRRLLGLSSLGVSFWRGGVTLDAGPAGVTIRCTRCFANDRVQLETFIRESIEVFRRLRAPGTAGLQILSVEESIARGACPVCAQPLDASARRCEGCSTPHHPECWDYLGGCAVYGCGRRGGTPEA